MENKQKDNLKKKLSDNSDMLAGLGTVGTLGFTMVLSTFAGLGIGLWLDKITGWRPWFTISCLLFGIIAGFVKIISEMNKKV